MCLSFQFLSFLEHGCIFSSKHASFCCGVTNPRFLESRIVSKDFPQSSYHKQAPLPNCGVVVLQSHTLPCSSTPCIRHIQSVDVSTHFLCLSRWWSMTFSLKFFSNLVPSDMVKASFQTQTKRTYNIYPNHMTLTRSTANLRPEGRNHFQSFHRQWKWLSVACLSVYLYCTFSYSVNYLILKG